MFKHLTKEERIIIQSGLNSNLSFTQIAKNINRPVSTVSREVSKYSSKVRTGAYGKNFNNCIHNFECKITNLCDDINCNKSYCKFCNKCLSICSKFQKKECELIKKSSATCNSCQSLRKCTLEKKIYKALEAHEMYEKQLSECREGFNITEEKIHEISKIISPATKRGLSLNAILANHKNEIMLSETTLYSYINAGIIEGVKNIDLPKKVVYKPRKKRINNFKVDKACRINRTYDCFLEFIEENPDANIVEMDTVEGIKGGKVLLTLYFRKTNFMLAFIRDSNNSKTVTDVFKWLFNTLGKEVFSTLFEVILTDNGSEFSDPKSIEYIEGTDSSNLVRVFYCEPSSPNQKAGVEKNHTLLRKIIPKGCSMNNLNQNDINLIFSHINSYCRQSLCNATPYYLFKTIYGEETLLNLGINFVPFEQLNLTPALIKFK